MSFENLEKIFFSAVPEFKIIVITGMSKMLGLRFKNDQGLFHLRPCSFSPEGTDALCLRIMNSLKSMIERSK